MLAGSKRLSRRLTGHCLLLRRFYHSGVWPWPESNASSRWLVEAPETWGDIGWNSGRIDDHSSLLRSWSKMFPYHIDRASHDYFRDLFNPVHERTAPFFSLSSSWVETHCKTLRQSASSIISLLNQWLLLQSFTRVDYIQYGQSSQLVPWVDSRPSLKACFAPGMVSLIGTWVQLLDQVF